MLDSSSSVFRRRALKSIPTARSGSLPPSPFMFIDADSYVTVQLKKLKEALEEQKSNDYMHSGLVSS